MVRLPLLLLLLTACAKPGADPVKPPEVEGTDEDADGYSPDEGDCDDNNPAINPGLDEQCNGLDDDCDGTTDVGLTSTFYADADQDGFGDAGDSVEACEAPEGFTSDSTDCDDANAARYPDNPEVCDGLDNNCDDAVDEGVTSTFYLDEDGDGVGSDVVLAACEVPEGYAAISGDCDDAEPLSAPGLIEICDGLDNNCDGATDEGLLTTYYADTDGDNFGDPDTSATTCNPLAGYTADSSDCDDTTSAISPTAEERCNDLDDNCDGVIDDDAADRLSWYPDLDGDGYGAAAGVLLECDAPVGYVLDSSDCDDTSAALAPSATERCNGIDDNCDGTTDIDASDRSAWYEDLDGDGYGVTATVLSCEQPSGMVAYDGDCDDTDPTLSPAAVEICDTFDNDCDGFSDESDASDAPTWYYDLDSDGYGDPTYFEVACEPRSAQVADNTDCDDGQPNANPSETERCNGFDDDCDGTTDEADAIDVTAWYQDLDGDGYGTDATETIACDQPVGYTANGADCDDAWDTAFPAGIEVCDEHDNNCNGTTDESSAVDAPTWYLDDDGDGYGTPFTVLAQCDQPPGYGLDNGDCDDTDRNVNPLEAEICNDVDDDCDGVTDTDAIDRITWYLDLDGDSFGAAGTTIVDCDRPINHVSVDGDCNDSSRNVYPGASERCDTTDQDCDGQVADDESVDAPLWYDDFDGDEHGVAGTATAACFEPADAADNDDDCDDSDDTVYTGSHWPETSRDSVDTDCDGNMDCDDLNCDGRPDLVFANYDNGTYALNSTIYYGNDARFASASTLSLPTLGARQAHVQDLDDDGYLDVLFVNEQSDSSFVVSSTIYWGSISGPSTTSFTSLPTKGARQVCVDDLDADGALDLVFANHEDDSTYDVDSIIYWGDGGRTYSDTDLLPTYAAVSCAIGDLDGDTWLDVAVAADGAASGYTQGQVYWGDGGRIDGRTVTQDTIEISGSRVFVADLDGAAPDDLLWLGLRSSTYYAPLHINQSLSSRVIGTDEQIVASYGTRDAEIADFNGDGALDIAIAAEQSATVDWTQVSYIYYQHTSGSFNSLDQDEVDVQGARAVTSADLDGDGDLDLVFANERSALTTFNVSSYIYWNETADDSNFLSTDRTEVATAGATGVSVGDLDGDGFADIVFSNGSGTSSYIYWGSALTYGAARRTSLTTAGPESDPVVVGSYP